MPIRFGKPKTRIDITNVYKNEEKLLKKRIRTDDEDHQIGFLSDQIREGRDFMIDMIPEEFTDELAYKLADMISKKKITSSDQMKIIIDKYKSEPAIKKGKTIEISEKGDIVPRGFSPAEKKIVNLIDTEKYSEDEIIFIMKGIVKGKFKKRSDFPKPENESDSEPEPEPEPKKTKGGARLGAGRKANEAKPKPVPLRVVPKRRGPKPKSTAGEKAMKEIKKNEEREAKKEAKKKPYFRADEPPKGFREATPKEAIDKKKVLLYGKKKLDSKLISSMFSTGKSLKEQIADIQVKIAGKMGKLSLIKSKLKHIAGDERVDNSDLTNAFNDMRQEISLLGDKKKKLEARKE